MPDPVTEADDLAFRADLARALARRYHVGAQARRVQFAGYLLCRVLAWAEARVQPGRYALATVTVGKDGAAKVHPMADETD